MATDRSANEESNPPGGPLRTESSPTQEKGADPALLLRNAALQTSGAILAAHRRAVEELLRTKESLEHLQRQHRMILDSVGEGLHGISVDGNIMFENPAAATMLGWDVSAMIGHHAHSLIHHTRADGSAYPVSECPIYATLRDGITRRVENEVFWRQDGTSLPVSYTSTPMLNESGEIVGTVVAFRDITERRRTETAMAHLSAIVESSNDAIIGKSLDGVVTSWNKGAERLFGFSAGEMIGKSITVVLPPDKTVEESTILFRLKHGEHIDHFETTRRRKDGLSIPVSLTISPIKDASGNIIGASKIVRDITERKRAEAVLHTVNATLALQANELAEARDQAQAADRTKSAFLATMSHELRTPLNSIIGFTGIILQGLAGPLNPEQSKQLEMVRGSARHLLALINDVLDISKIEAGQLEVAREPFDLRTSISKVIGIVTPLTAKHGLAFRVQLAPELGQAISDERRFEQILLNLLSNAIKFTERGEVALSAELVGDVMSPGEILPRRAVRLSVADTGMGIKPADMATLFQPFRQIDSGLSRNHEGTGLGLAICRRLADLMGGKISAQSEWQKGSTFTFTLPLIPISVV